jgi:hypothetical protein
MQQSAILSALGILRDSGLDPDIKVDLLHAETYHVLLPRVQAFDDAAAKFREAGINATMHLDPETGERTHITLSPAVCDGTLSTAVLSVKFDMLASLSKRTRLYAKG